MSAQFDFSEIRVMLDAINRATAVAPAEAMAVVTKGALNIREDARHRVTGHRHLPLYPLAITADTYVSLTGPSAEIGPDKTKPQGPLGNIVEYGSVKNPPIPHMLPAGEAEQPRFEAAMEALMVKALGPVFT